MKRWAIAVAICGIGCATLMAQISARPGVTTLLAIVTDRDGRNVPDLKPADFTLTENGKQQEITAAELSRNQPLSLGIVLDVNTSMQSKLAAVATALDGFARSLEPEDDIFFMSFAGFPTMDEDLTTDRDRITKALRGIRWSDGRALYDAVEKAVSGIRDGKQLRKVMLLITDGQDTANQTTLNDALFAVRESDVTLYCVGIGSNVSAGIGRPGIPPSTNPNPIPSPGGAGGGNPTIRLPGGIQLPLPGPARRQFPSNNGNETDNVDMSILERLAVATAGTASLVATPTVRENTMEDALDRVLRELQNQYIIRFRPDHRPDGKFHPVVLRTKNSRYQVRARKEYFAADNPVR